jgi:ribonuclease HI
MTDYKVYVDGSYFDGKVGYGAVVLENDELIKEFCGFVPSEHVENTRQVAGELFAVGLALRWCKERNITHLTLYYDYLGIEKWATGEWKTNISLTQRYARFMKEMPIRITWKKVKSHAGNYWNEYVDVLAKKGAQGCNKDYSTIQTHKTQDSSNEVDVKEVEKVRIEEARVAAEKFLIFLKQTQFLERHGLIARLDKAYNQQFFRINFHFADNQIGRLDLYNTQNKPFHLRISGSNQAYLEEHIRKEWQIFRDQINLPTK